MTTVETPFRRKGEEAQRVLGWRLEELERAGYDHEDALAIAERTEVDLHEAVELVVAGCNHHTAIKILL